MTDASCAFNALFHDPYHKWVPAIVFEVDGDQSADLIAFCVNESANTGPYGERVGQWYHFTGVPLADALDVRPVSWRRLR